MTSHFVAGTNTFKYCWCFCFWRGACLCTPLCLLALYYCLIIMGSQHWWLLTFMAALHNFKIICYMSIFIVFLWKINSSSSSSCSNKPTSHTKNKVSVTFCVVRITRLNKVGVNRHCQASRASQRIGCLFQRNWKNNRMPQSISRIINTVYSNKCMILLNIIWFNTTEKLCNQNFTTCFLDNTRRIHSSTDCRLR